MQWTQPDTRHPTPDTRAFSLIELLVVISIILVLVGLMIYVGIERKGSEVMTRKTMDVMLSALTEYTALTNGLVPDHRSTMWEKGTPDNDFTNDEYTMSSEANEFFGVACTLGSTMDGCVPLSDMNSIERFIWKTGQYPSVQKMYASMGADVFTDSDGDGMMEVMDAWARPLRFVTRLNYADPTSHEDFDTHTNVDGSSKNTAAKFYDADDENSKMPVAARPYFASRGRDGKWGEADSADADYEEAAKDNLYTLTLE